MFGFRQGRSSGFVCVLEMKSYLKFQFKMEFRVELCLNKLSLENNDVYTNYIGNAILRKVSFETFCILHLQI